MKYTTNEQVKNLLKCSKAYEKKLIELMGEKAFKQFSIELAKDMFYDSIRNIEDSHFRNFCLDQFDNITNVSDCSTLDFPNSEEGDNMD
nr:MAG TPA: Helicase loader [Caudoviricetes sp.]